LNSPFSTPWQGKQSDTHQGENAARRRNDAALPTLQRQKNGGGMPRRFAAPDAPE